MRICVVTVAGYPHGIGGMQDHTVDLVRGLVTKGHEVEVINPRHPEGLPRAERDGAIWHFVDSPASRERLPMRHPGWLRMSADTFATVHAASPFDLVHSESTSALGLLHRGWHKRVPIVAKFHGNYLTFMRTAVRQIAARQHVVREAKGILWVSGAHFLTRGNWHAFRACDVMVPSRAQLDDAIRSHLLDRSRVRVVPNGVDADVFCPGDRGEARADLGLAGGFLLVWLGRMYPGKGAHIAIEALSRSNSDARLLLIGDGESRAELESFARELGVTDRAEFAGLQPRERIPTYLRAADALVFPTLLPEAAPLTPLQAMSSGLPVVASRIGSIPELIDEPGANGLLVEPGDVDALGHAMTQLAADEALRARLGTGARTRVLSTYTLERMIEQTVEMYRASLARFQSAR